MIPLNCNKCYYKYITFSVNNLNLLYIDKYGIYCKKNLKKKTRWAPNVM